MSGLSDLIIIIPVSSIEQGLMLSSCSSPGGKDKGKVPSCAPWEQSYTMDSSLQVPDTVRGGPCQSCTMDSSLRVLDTVRGGPCLLCPLTLPSVSSASLLFTLSFTLSMQCCGPGSSPVIPVIQHTCCADCRYSFACLWADLVSGHL